MTCSTPGADDGMVSRITAFLREIGIAVEPATLVEATFLPGIKVRNGALCVDPDRLLHPGDLLHEAGHIAVCDPAQRAALAEIPADGGDEMAAIAWSYAAARRLGVPSDVLFHDGGYGGPCNNLAANFDSGAWFGVPLLQWYGMTIEPHAAGPDDPPPYPHMLRWLR